MSLFGTYIVGELLISWLLWEYAGIVNTCILNLMMRSLFIETL